MPTEDEILKQMNLLDADGIGTSDYVEWLCNRFWHCPDEVKHAESLASKRGSEKIRSATVRAHHRLENTRESVRGAESKIKQFKHGIITKEELTHDLCDFGYAEDEHLRIAREEIQRLGSSDPSDEVRLATAEAAWWWRWDEQQDRNVDHIRRTSLLQPRSLLTLTVVSTPTLKTGETLRTSIGTKLRARFVDFIVTRYAGCSRMPLALVTLHPPDDQSSQDGAIPGGTFALLRLQGRFDEWLEAGTVDVHLEPGLLWDWEVGPETKIFFMGYIDPTRLPGCVLAGSASCSISRETIFEAPDHPGYMMNQYHFEVARNDEPGVGLSLEAARCALRESSDYRAWEAVSALEVLANADWFYFSSDGSHSFLVERSSGKVMAFSNELPPALQVWACCRGFDAWTMTGKENDLVITSIQNQEQCARLLKRFYPPRTFAKDVAPMLSRPPVTLSHFHLSYGRMCELWQAEKDSWFTFDVRPHGFVEP